MFHTIIVRELVQEQCSVARVRYISNVLQRGKGTGASNVLQLWNRYRSKGTSTKTMFCGNGKVQEQCSVVRELVQEHCSVARVRYISIVLQRGKGTGASNVLQLWNRHRSNILQRRNRYRSKGTGTKAMFCGDGKVQEQSSMAMEQLQEQCSVVREQVQKRSNVSQRGAGTGTPIGSPN